MAELGATASEVLTGGSRIFCKVDMGTFTASSLVFDGGLVHEDNSTGRRVGTYATPVRTNDLVKVSSGVDDDDLVVRRIDFTSMGTGADVFGIVESIRGNAGDALWDCIVYTFGDSDIIECEVGATDGESANGAGVLAVGDAVTPDDGDGYDDTKIHGVTWKEATTNALGYVMNSTDAVGEKFRLLIKRGT